MQHCHVRVVQAPVLPVNPPSPTLSYATTVSSILDLNDSSHPSPSSSSSPDESYLASPEPLPRHKRKTRRGRRGRRRRGGRKKKGQGSDNFAAPAQSLHHAIMQCFPQHVPSYEPHLSRGYTTIDDHHGFVVRLNYDASDVKYGIEQGRVIDDVWPSELLPDFTYTFVITVCGHITYGRCLDGWQVGVKHMALAKGRKVVCAGEISIAVDGLSCCYNLDSGQFTRKMVDCGMTTEDKLSSALQALLAQDRFVTRTFARRSILAPVDTPTAHELQQLLDAGFFCRQNPSLVNTVHAFILQKS